MNQRIFVEVVMSFFPCRNFESMWLVAVKKRRRKSVGGTSSKCVKAIDLSNDGYAQ